MNKPTVITPPIISNGDSMSFSDIASWGKTPIVGVSIAVFIVVLSVGYYFLIDNKLQDQMLSSIVALFKDKSLLG